MNMNQIRHPVLGYKFMMMSFQLKVQFCILCLAPVFQLLSHLLVILPICGWAPWTTEMMVIETMFKDCLQGILQVVDRASL
jgi:hypothetical protein